MPATAQNDNSQAQTANSNANSSNDNGSTEAQQVASGAKEVLYRVGWSYSIYLSRNGFSPSAHASEDWLRRAREASKRQVALIAELSSAGAKTRCSQKAVFNKRDGRWDTALTARVVKPGCSDQDLIVDALTKAQQRASKSLSDMRQAAIGQGAIEVAIG